MNGEGYQSSPDADIEVDKDINENTSTLLQQEKSESLKEAAFIKGKKNKFMVMRVIALFVVILGVVLGIMLSESNTYIHLKRSKGDVKVQYVNEVPKPSIYAIYERVTISEFDLFNKSDTSIFKGEVKDIKNIKIEFGKEQGEGSTNYKAIAKIKVDEVYRGNEKSGDIIKAYIPCAIGTSEWVWDARDDVLSAIRVGTKGIFMPIKYDENDYWDELGGTLYLKDISDYGFRDGMRYAFIQTKKGTLYGKYGDVGQNTLPGALTLDDVKKHVLEMIKQAK